jgi:hypothetical protein
MQGSRSGSGRAAVVPPRHTRGHSFPTNAAGSSRPREIHRPPSPTQSLRRCPADRGKGWAGKGASLVFNETLAPPKAFRSIFEPYSGTYCVYLCVSLCICVSVSPCLCVCARSLIAYHARPCRHRK